nr:hypothetical protein [uncultured Treponema sp.]
MSEKLLFVFEGEKTEPQIFKSLKNTLFSDIKDFELYACYGSHIYSLYQQLEKDEDLDIVELVREKNKQKLTGISRNDIALVYLFFDYDPQTGKKCNAIIPKMLEKFNNETENGKLFISYPMVEAVKDSASEKFLSDEEHRTILLKDSKNYKNIVSTKIESALKYFAQYTTITWERIIKQTLQQASWILHDKDMLPDIDTAKQMSQSDIYDAEYNKYLTQQNSMAILSAFPFFIMEYFPKEFIQKNILNDSDQ